MIRYAARRDQNEPDLFQFAETLGAKILRNGPLDAWIWWRGKWTLTEVKLPGRRGHRNEYTPLQVRLLSELKDRAIPVWIWRTREDVLRDFEARIA